MRVDPLEPGFVYYNTHKCFKFQWRNLAPSSVKFITGTISAEEHRIIRDLSGWDALEAYEACIRKLIKMSESIDIISLEFLGNALLFCILYDLFPISVYEAKGSYSARG